MISPKSCRRQTPCLLLPAPRAAASYQNCQPRYWEFEVNCYLTWSLRSAPSNPFSVSEFCIPLAHDVAPYYLSVIAKRFLRWDSKHPFLLAPQPLSLPCSYFHSVISLTLMEQSSFRVNLSNVPIRSLKIKGYSYSVQVMRRILYYLTRDLRIISQLAEGRLYTILNIHKH